MAQKPPFNPYEFIDRSQPMQRKGQFVYYEASLKDLIQSHIDGDPNSPFSNVKIGGTRSYAQENNRLKLESVVFGTSGYVSLKMADNFQAIFYARTENNDYFEDQALDSISSDWSNTTDAREQLAEAGWPSVWVQDDAEFSDSRAVFGLDSGDYVSIDVDGESSSVAQMRVRLSGVDYFNNREISNETFLTKLWIRKWEANLVNPLFEDDEGDDEDGDGDSEPINPPPSPDKECPVGYTYDEDLGACVPLEEENGGDEDESTPTDDISTGAVILVALAVGTILFVAVRVR